MRRAALFIVLTGLALAPVWGAVPAEACENCACQGEGTGQVSQMIQALTGGREYPPGGWGGGQVRQTDDHG